MFSPRVWNKRNPIDIPLDAVLVDRTTKWGNPFRSGTNGWTREDIIRRYRDWLWLDRTAPNRERPPSIEDVIKELKGKDLVCWCFPKRCHADILIEIANRNET